MNSMNSSIICCPSLHATCVLPNVCHMCACGVCVNAPNFRETLLQLLHSTSPRRLISDFYLTAIWLFHSMSMTAGRLRLGKNIDFFIFLILFFYTPFLLPPGLSLDLGLPLALNQVDATRRHHKRHLTESEKKKLYVCLGLPFH